MTADALAWLRCVYQALLDGVDSEPGAPGLTAYQIARATGLDLDTVTHCLALLESRSVVMLAPGQHGDTVRAAPVRKQPGSRAGHAPPPPDGMRGRSAKPGAT
jgi:alpha-D-ribose 1-methylphosphonate 5-triphosphate synthase subunit PhnH